MENQPLPFVTAVCISGKDPGRVAKFLPVATDCFHRQTYPPGRRELVIVADGCFDLLPTSQGNVRVVAVQSKKSLGELRNIGLDAAFGTLSGDTPRSADLVIQWDEDWHHPERIAVQTSEQSRQPQMPLILARQLAYCLEHDVAYEREVWVSGDNPTQQVNAGIHGTIIHPRDDSKRYPAKPTQEDTDFLRLWGGFTMIDNAPGLYVRFAHEGSVSGRDHVMRQAARWPNGTWGINEHNSVPILREALAALGIPARHGGQSQAAPSEGIPELVEG